MNNNNMTATICDKAEQIYKHFEEANINYTQEDGDAINNILDEIIAIQKKRLMDLIKKNSIKKKIDLN